MVVSGQVDLYKLGNTGEKKKLKPKSWFNFWGSCFLKGRVSSVTAEISDVSLLWRMNHESLLTFLSEHSASAGQLCLNLAVY